jgi:hypothetical protein
VTLRRRLHELCLLSGTVVASALTGCSLSYGADFDYPGQPPLPAGATVIAGAQGWDNDDPLRGREVVVDIGSASQDELLAFYRTQFPSAAGWQQGDPDPQSGPDHLLCLVSHSDPRFDEYVEIYTYKRRFTSADPHRYLVSISRLTAGHGERDLSRCGVARAWFPGDL